MNVDPFNAGIKLRKLREFHNFTQEYVATQLGVATNTLSDYENGKVRMSYEKLSLAAKLFKVEVSLFFSPDPLTFNINNSSGPNGYNVIHELNLTNKEMFDRMLSHLEERTKRMEELYSRTLDLLERSLGERT